MLDTMQRGISDRVWRPVLQWQHTSNGLDIPIGVGARLTDAALRTARDWMFDEIARAPDELIPPAEENPDTYMRRWYVERSRDCGNIYLHEFLRSDDDRAKHDHPWRSVSVLLDGLYIEHIGARQYLRQPGDIVKRTAEATHRIELVDGQTCHSLFLTGPKTREWGFHCEKGWVHWQEFGRMRCA
jgi:hypothetical protein